MCEKCWADAYLRCLKDPEKSQTEHYHDLLEERRMSPCGGRVKSLPEIVADNNRAQAAYNTPNLNEAVTTASTLPQGYKERKDLPICTGVLDYFPLALAEVSRVSFVGNQQHNPGEPLHWAKEKSQDDEDAHIRHWMERYEIDGDGVYHAAKAAWRNLAFLQKLIEAKQHGMSYQQYNEYLKKVPGMVFDV